MTNTYACLIEENHSHPANAGERIGTVKYIVRYNWLIGYYVDDISAPGWLNAWAEVTNGGNWEHVYSAHGEDIATAIAEAHRVNHA